jgi:hypothetical protein
LILGLNSVEWSTIVTASVTTIATVVLAAVAIRTMRDTRRSIKATEKQTDFAARAFNLQIEPQLIPYAGHPTIGDPVDVGGMVGQEWVVPLDITVVNVGNGVARIDSIEAIKTPGGPPHRVIPAPVAQPGTLTSLRLEFMRPTPEQGAPAYEPFKPGDSVSRSLSFAEL